MQSEEYEKMETKISVDDIAYCGLNCRLCNITTILPETAGKLHKIMQDDGWEHYGSQLYEAFADFWKVLASLAQMKDSCPQCKGACGHPECVIRLCAQKKGLRLCAECNEYPCLPHKEFFSGRYQKLAQNNERIRSAGLEAWLKEQQELVDRGLSFRDLV